MAKSCSCPAWFNWVLLIAGILYLLAAWTPNFGWWEANFPWYGVLFTLWGLKKVSSN